MGTSQAVRDRSPGYELRFSGLLHPGRGYAFPCDASGHVDIDALSEAGRLNYFYARALVGRELSWPETCSIGDGRTSWCCRD